MTNNIHRSPKLIPLSAFWSPPSGRRSISLAAAPASSRWPAVHSAGGEERRSSLPAMTSPSSRCRVGTLSGQLGLSLPVAFAPPPTPHTPHPTPPPLPTECLVRTFAFGANSPQMDVYLGWWYLLIGSQFPFRLCARSLIHNRFLSFSAPRSNVTLIIKRLISLTWVMPRIENIYVKCFQKVKEVIKQNRPFLFSPPSTCHSLFSPFLLLSLFFDFNLNVIFDSLSLEPPWPFLFCCCGCLKWWFIRPSTMHLYQSSSFPLGRLSPCVPSFIWFCFALWRAPRSLHELC